MALDEQLSLVREALIEWQGDRSPHRLDAPERPLASARNSGKLLLGPVEHGGVDVPHLLRAISGRTGTRLAIEDPLRIGDSGGNVIAVCNLVDQSEFKGQRSRDGIASRDHLERPLNPNQARQALSPARTRQQSKLHLRKSEAGLRIGDTSLAPHGHFQSAAKWRPVQCGHCWFFGGLVGVDDFPQAGLLHGFSEFLDIGTRHERLAAPRDDDCLDGIICCRLVEAAEQAFAHGVCERVDWRVVDGDDAHTPPPFPSNRIGH